MTKLNYRLLINFLTRQKQLGPSILPFFFSNYYSIFNILNSDFLKRLLAISTFTLYVSNV